MVSSSAFRLARLAGPQSCSGLGSHLGTPVLELIRVPSRAVKSTVVVAGLSRMALAGEFSPRFLGGCFPHHARMMSNTTAFGAFVLTAVGSVCATETSYPAFMMADRRSAMGGQSACMVLASLGTV